MSGSWGVIWRIEGGGGAIGATHPNNSGNSVQRGNKNKLRVGETKGMKTEEVKKKTEGVGKLKKRESNQIKPIRLNPLKCCQMACFHRVVRFSSVRYAIMSVSIVRSCECTKIVNRTPFFLFLFYKGYQKGGALNCRTLIG